MFNALDVGAECLGSVKMPATEKVDSGSIPGRVIPTTIRFGIHSFRV